MNTQKENCRKPLVYLAGGFKSSWQDLIMAANTEILYIDPRKHGLLSSDQYTFWDLEAISRCDWLFAYAEKSNPGGYALALEIGYAKALGKRIILVDDRSPTDKTFQRYWEMCRACADIKFETLELGLEFIANIKFVFE